ncbi:MAG: ABC transporter permease [Clostridiales bacterium]|nr:ABC transporter permease [Clostridiales bacterium]
METTGMLMKSYLKKSKGQMLSLFLLIVIAVTILNTGALVFFNYQRSFLNRMEELNGAHFMAALPKSDEDDQYLTFIQNYKGVNQVETQQVLIFPGASLPYGDSRLEQVFLITSLGDDRDISKLNMVEEDASIQNGIYLPYIMKTGGYHKIGETFDIQFNHKTYEFTIAGFIEDVSLTSSINLGGIGAYLKEGDFKNLQEKSKEWNNLGTLVSARMDDYRDSVNLTSDFKKQMSGAQRLEGTAMNLWCQDAVLGVRARTLTSNIGGSVMISFALIIVLISMVVIRFRIINMIEEDMKNVGVLKALGYTSGQIVISFVLQFAVIGGIGAVLGVLASYGVLPLINDLFSAQTGIVWHQGFHAAISIIVIVLILIITGSIAFFASGRINHLHPILAIRGGIATHSFRKNVIALDQSKGTLNLLLAAKNALQNTKKNVMIGIIISFLTFVALFAWTMYYNIALDKDSFLNIIGAEMADFVAVVPENEKAGSFQNKIQDMDNVRKTFYYDTLSTRVNGTDCMATVLEDFQVIENNTIYKGRYPKHDNEAAMGALLSEVLGKEIGDTIIVESGNEKKGYLVTGLTQGSFYLGMDIMVTKTGIEEILPAFKQSNLYVYLNQSDDRALAVFQDHINKMYGEDEISLTKNKEVIFSTINIYSKMTTIIAIGILCTTVLVITLVLYLIIRMMITRQKQYYGIQKSIGFTTGQIIRQIIFSLMPPIAAGAVAGGVISMLTMNRVISVLFKSLGVMNANFIIQPLGVAGIIAGIIVVSYALGYLIAGRIRKITPYNLITE